MTRDEFYECKNRFINLLKSTEIDDIDYVLKEIEDSGFYQAPASMKGHLSFEGGLLCHSLNVYDAAMELKKSIGGLRSDIFEEISDTSIIIVTLLHDMCKANLYRKRRGAQVDFGKAEYGRDDTELPVGHGEKSVVMLLQMGLGLTDAEICAIRWHMGAWCVNPNDQDSHACYRSAERQFPLVTLLQLADTIASKFTERPPKTIN